MVVQQIVLCAWLICLNRTGPSGAQLNRLATRLPGHLTFASRETGRPPHPAIVSTSHSNAPRCALIPPASDCHDDQVLSSLWTPFRCTRSASGHRRRDPQIGCDVRAEEVPVLALRQPPRVSGRPRSCETPPGGLTRSVASTWGDARLRAGDERHGSDGGARPERRLGLAREPRRVRRREPPNELQQLRRPGQLVRHGRDARHEHLLEHSWTGGTQLLAV